MKSDIGDESVSFLIDGQSVRHVEHSRSPRVFDFSCVRIQSQQGVVRNRNTIDQLVTGVEGAEKDNIFI